MVEKTIADFFINNQKKINFSAKSVAAKLLFQKLLCHDLPRSVDIGAIENLFTSMKKALSKKKEFMTGNTLMIFECLSGIYKSLRTVLWMKNKSKELEII